MSEIPLPTMPEDLEPTRATLHAYALAVGALPRAHGIPHPKWWHISLEVAPTGLVTDPMPLPGGGTLHLRMDLRSHQVVVETSSGIEERVSMAEGLTGTQLGDALIAAVADLGLVGEYARAKFENDDPRAYDPEAADRFWEVLTNVDAVLERHRSTLDGWCGPLQVWPHGFDLAFEWFGTRRVEYEEDGERRLLPAQLNLGFYPGGDSYFYSNPWPFAADHLLSVELPGDADWHTEGWQGAMLPYAAVAGRPDAAERVAAFAAAVHAGAAPTLQAD